MFRKILLVEDNNAIAENIVNFLKLDHKNVDVASDGLLGRDMFIKDPQKYDLIILDLMLPKVDGQELCKRIKQKYDIPIIMSTAKWQIEDKLEWFWNWADDYLVKPFDLSELSARIDILLKRVSKFDQFKYWDIVIDLEKRNITKLWKNVYLTIKEFYILDVLIRNYWFPVSRADIIEFVRGWDEIFHESGKLDVYISRLRKKTSKDLIQTVSWFGYKIQK